MKSSQSSGETRHTGLRAIVLAGGLVAALMPLTSLAQTTGEAGSTASEATEDLPSLWELAIEGGLFMIPIGLASIVTIAFTLERRFGLRRNAILPRKLILELRGLMTENGLDPRKVWKVCLDYPSPLSNVVKAAVLKIGRPHAEVEKAVEDAVARETTEMTRNLRPINVVASIAPLLGLLGTVQGMILAFMVTSTTSATGAYKAQELAQGIYTALVTTFAGLCVAVVSVVLVNVLEGRIERLLQRMESIFLDLLPQLERFEGRLRVSESATEDGDGVRLRATRTPPTASDRPAPRPASPRQNDEDGPPPVLTRRTADEADAQPFEIPKVLDAMTSEAGE